MAKGPTRCRRCGKPKTAKRPISKLGNCPPCGKRAMLAAIDQLQRKSGPEYDKWAKRSPSVGRLESTP